MFIFKRIKKLEEDVSELKAENEKLHRIIKHAGSEPVAYIKENYHDGVIYNYTLYYYKDNTEYSVELGKRTDIILDNSKIKILKDENGVVFLDCLVETFKKYYYPYSHIAPKRLIIVFCYLLHTYEIHNIDDDIIKVYKNL